MTPPDLVLPLESKSAREAPWTSNGGHLAEARGARSPHAALAAALLFAASVLGVLVTALGCDRTPEPNLGPAAGSSSASENSPRSGDRGSIPQFAVRSPSCGIDFVNVCGGRDKDWILEVNGGGVALFDYDSDGDLDVFLVNGARLPDDPRAASEEPPSDRLYENLGGWRFRDVTKSAKLEESAWGCGVVAGDVEGDGDLDLFVANYGSDELWINQGDGTFAAEGAARGVADEEWGSSAAFLDFDRDGGLDLFVVNYLEFDRDAWHSRTERPCDYKGQKILCGPVGLPRARCVLYRNDGEGRFEDVSIATGIAAKDVYGLGVAVGDYDSDGWPDLYVASDTTENLLFHNIEGRTFEEVGLPAGVARNEMAVAQAGMGVELAYISSQVYEDIFVVNYEDDTNTLYRNEGTGFFTEVTAERGLASPCFKYLGWACFFADFDFDADLDLFIAQGHVVPQVDEAPSSSGYRQPNKLFLNVGNGRFADVSSDAGPGLAVVESSRGAAYGDLDGDGDLDLVINEIDAPATVLECTGPPLGHWLGVELAGTRSNRNGIGAVVRVTAGGKVQARRVRSGIGYASFPELTIRFGLGSAASIESLTVEWPTGSTERFNVDRLDHVMRLQEGKGESVTPKPEPR